MDHVSATATLSCNRGHDVLTASLSCAMPSSPSTHNSPAEDQFLGVYSFEHPGGVFDVHLRPFTKFFAPNFHEKASWAFTSSKLLIEWGKYGQYVLDVDMAAQTPSFSGSAQGDPSNWRKMTMKRPFSQLELKLMNSEWNFVHPGGSFAIEFRADSVNSFVCEGFPANAYWSMEELLVGSDDAAVYINWGKYGEYELKMAADGESMTGSAKGRPENWRKAERLRSLGDASNPFKNKRSREGCGGCKKGCGECGRD